MGYPPRPAIPRPARTPLRRATPPLHAAAGLALLLAPLAALACSAGAPPPEIAAVPAHGPTAAPAPSVSQTTDASASAQPACEPLATEGFEHPHAGNYTPTSTPIEWGDRLAPFYESLARLERGKLDEPLRIAVHGDSNLTKDGLTGELRRVLQSRYSDAGHGFMPAVRAWGWYRHQNVLHDNDAWWRALAISAPRTPDLGYGISGIAAVCRSPGGRTWFQTANEDSPVGQKVSRIGVYFRKHPGGGRFDVLLDGDPTETIDTESDTVSAGERVYHVPDAPHRLDLLTTSAGETRILGVSFERDRPGVVVDTFGVGGSYFQALTLDDHELSRQMAAQRKHALVIYWLGANPHYAHQYPRDIKIVVDERRKDDKDLPVLLVSPPDTASQGKNSPSNPVSPMIVREMRGAADANATAFWPMRDAQGGEGGGGRFLRYGLAVDKQHLSPEGSNLMARMLLHELWRDYHRYLATHPRAGCDAPPAAKR